MQSSQLSIDLLVDETPDQLHSQGSFVSQSEALRESSVGRHATGNYSALKPKCQLQVSRESFIIISREKEMSEPKRKQQQRVTDMFPYLLLIHDTHLRWKTTKKCQQLSVVDFSWRSESHK